MNLQFTNKGGNFVSEFEVTSDFNLHIEGVRLSDMHIYQKTAGGSYAKVTDFPSERSQDRVADFDFASLVYPKFIKVVCATEPTYAEIATDGEVTEIKSQSKDVEITSNGVTEIAPDAGFGYLSGVKVNVNVPSGGGDAPSGGGGLKYFVPPAGLRVYGIWGTLCKLKDPDKDSVRGIAPSSLYVTDGGTPSEASSIMLAFAVDLNMEVWLEALNKIVTWRELMKIMHGEDLVVHLTEITKEEFYDLNNLHTL